MSLRETSPITYYLCQMEVITQFVRLLEIKRYSSSSINTYKNCLRSFFAAHPAKDPMDIADKEIFDFVYQLVTVKNVSFSYQKQMVGALKLFYLELYKRKLHVNYIIPSRAEARLPVVLSKHEIERIIDHTQNLKHKAILCLIYSGGLRVSEAVNLKIKDVDSSRMVINIRNAKGRRDREIMLSANLLVLLRQYFREYRPAVWLFEGQGNEKYSVRSIQNILKASCTKAGIRKQATVHTLRHSFATHLVENGTDIRVIQELLGHKSIKTTRVYTHITEAVRSRVKSPFDSIKLK